MTFNMQQALPYAGRNPAARIYRGARCWRGHRGFRYAANHTCVDCVKLHDRRYRPDNPVDHQVTPRIRMVISDWYHDEFGNLTRTVRAAE